MIINKITDLFYPRFQSKWIINILLKFFTLSNIIKFHKSYITDPFYIEFIMNKKLLKYIAIGPKNG